MSLVRLIRKLRMRSGVPGSMPETSSSYRQLTETRALINLARKDAGRKCFRRTTPGPPMSARHRNRLKRYSAEFEAPIYPSPRLQRLFTDHSRHGVDPERLYLDIFPPAFGVSLTLPVFSGIAYAFQPHRDTWYSAPMCQLNWWSRYIRSSPITPMGGFYPRYFFWKAAQNNRNYHYYEWNTKHRATAASTSRATRGSSQSRCKNLNLSPSVSFLRLRSCPVLRWSIPRDVPNMTYVRALQRRFSDRALDDVSLAAVHQTLIHAAQEQRCATICGQTIDAPATRRNRTLR